MSTSTIFQQRRSQMEQKLYGTSNCTRTSTVASMATCGRILTGSQWRPKYLYRLAYPFERRQYRINGYKYQEYLASVPRSTSTSTCIASSSISKDVFINQRVTATYNWFHNIVIGQKLCPFAPPFHKNPELMRVVCASPDTEYHQAIELVQREVKDLLLSPKETESKTRLHETTLVILDLPEWSSDFRAFIHFSWELQEKVIVKDNCLGELQLVLFHPLAMHQTYGTNEMECSAGDFTIRSPYPIIHLLREMDVQRAVEGGYPNLDTLPSRNKAKLIQQGVEHCQKRLQACYYDVGTILNENGRTNRNT